MKCFIAIILVGLFALAYGLPSAKQVQPENIEPTEEELLPSIPEDAPRDKRGYYYSAPYSYSGYSGYPVRYNTYQYRTYPYHYNAQYYG